MHTFLVKLRSYSYVLYSLRYKPIKLIEKKHMNPFLRHYNSSKAFRQKQNAVQVCLRLTLRPYLYKDSLKKGVKNSIGNCFLSTCSLNLIIQLGIKKR